MRVLYVYLIGYFALVIGAGLALWQAGAARHVSPFWLGAAALIAVSLGVLLAVTSTRPTATTPS